MYRNKQLGLGLPSAIFLILVMTLILAAINQINESSAISQGREWLNIRAFYAAESGLQMSAVQAINPSQVMNACNVNFISDFNFTMSGLDGCNVNVACNEKVELGKRYYTFTSTGSCGSEPDKANRVIQMRLVQ